MSLHACVSCGRVECPGVLQRCLACAATAPSVSDCLEWITLEDDKWRRANGLHPATNPGLGMSPTQWAKHCRDAITARSK